MVCLSCGKHNSLWVSVCSECGVKLGPTTEARRGSESSGERSPGAPAVDTGPHRFPPGRSFGSRYTIVDRLGQGGMGVVYKAFDRELDRSVALKLIRADQLNEPDVRVRFRRELALAQEVTHPNVCRVHDLGEADGIPYLSMELLEGHTLADLIQEVGRLSARQTIEIAEKICAGLEAIHTQRIVHRDLKPSNIGIAPCGRTVVMDFGIARRPFESHVTEPGRLVGTYSYLAPEQIHSRTIDEKTDIYALGLILYEMLTGRRPPGDDDRRPLALRGEREECPPPSHHDSGVPVPLDRLVMRCLSWEPKKRPSTVSTVRDALRDCGNLLGSQSQKGILRRLTHPSLSARLGRASWIAAGLTAATVGAFFLLTAFGGDWGNPVASRPARRIAILPFELEEKESPHAYLACVVTEALTAGLESDPAFAVAPFATVMSVVKTQPPDTTLVVDLARALGVDAVARGKVQVKGEKLAITTELASASGEELWAATMEGPVATPLRVVEAVKEALSRELGGGAGVAILQVRTPSMDAYQKYLAGLERYERGFRVKDLEEASSLLKEAIKTDPDFAAAHAALSRVLVTHFYQTKEPALIPEAGEAVRLALTLAPNLPEVLIASGFVEGARGNSVQAEAALNRAIELAPGSDSAHRVLANLYRDLGRHEEARSHFERAVELRPGHWRSHYALGRYLLVQVGDLTGARAHLLKAEALNSTETAPKLALGNISLDQGDLDEAETWYRKALDLDPHPLTHHNLGWVYYHRHEFDRASRSFRAAYDLVPSVPMYALWLAHALRQLNQTQEAEEFYRLAEKQYRSLIAETPDDADSHAGLAEVLASRGQCDAAQKEMQEAIDAHPGSSEFASQAAFCSFRCGKEEDAVRQLLQSIHSGNVLRARFNPDLAPLQQVPMVRAALERATARPR